MPPLEGPQCPLCPPRGQSSPPSKRSILLGHPAACLTDRSGGAIQCYLTRTMPPPTRHRSSLTVATTPPPRIAQTNQRPGTRAAKGHGHFFCTLGPCLVCIAGGGATSGTLPHCVRSELDHAALAHDAEFRPRHCSARLLVAKFTKTACVCMNECTSAGLPRWVTPDQWRAGVRQLTSCRLRVWICSISAAPPRPEGQDGQRGRDTHWHDWHGTSGD